MKKIKYYSLIAMILIFSSVIMFYFHYIVFGQLKNTMYYTIMDLCFIPINTFVVTIVFENLIERRSKREKLSKINMLVGLFFSEMGFELLNIFAKCDENSHKLKISFDNSRIATDNIKEYKNDININKINFSYLKKLSIANKDILISLIGNENILEHEMFADLLMSIMHLRDELVLRDIDNLLDNDLNHLRIDIIRVYDILLAQWIQYLFHMKNEYPYLYTTACEMSPFKN